MGKLLSIAAPLALSVLAPGLGTAIGGSLLGAGAAGSATLGNALVGAGMGALSGGGLKGAALGGLTGGIGANIGSIGSNIQGPVQAGGASLGNTGSGILGAIGDAAPALRDLSTSVGNSFTNLTNPLMSATKGFNDPTPVSTNPLLNATKTLMGTARGVTPAAGSAAEAGARALGVSGNSMGSGLLGELGAVGRGVQGITDSVGGLVGGEGGGSTFSNLASLGSFASNVGGGIADDEALKKAQEALLAGNQAQLGAIEQGTDEQLANLETYDADSYLSDPAYLAQQQQGEKALNRTLGATGNVFSGRALSAASDLNRSLASDAERAAYLRWLERTGQKNQLIGGRAGARGTTSIGNANTRAGVGIARGNNLSNTLVNTFGG
jgi:hypothetical protein